MEEPRYEPAEAILAACRERPVELKVAGLWRTGRLEGLALSCVAIVGTRAATPYGRGLARDFARSLGGAGCCIISGLALGIDAEAHAGALEAGAPTIGVLGGGHRRFFPKRNVALAQRMLDGGGAVLSPFDPEHPAYAAQFLQRNGIVAGLADAIVVIEAPARSGALNTASWGAGRIPVFAVPGDVDRPHVQGCLALLRDGAILARHAGDVLETLGRPALPLASAPARGDSLLLRALAEGEQDVDALVERTGVSAPAALAELAVLELEGVVECRGPTCYALRQCSSA